jgi:general secretion pathway protein A
MYESFYGLSKRPFALTPDSMFLFPSATHRRALSYLIYGLGQREGFIVITGDVGTGKTLTIQTMLDYLANKQIRGVRIAAANVGAAEVLPLVASAFGLSPEISSKAALLTELERTLLHAYPKGVLLIVDEAQTFSAEALEELRLLSNMSMEGRALMQISLVGQSDLRETLDSPRMEQLWQRIIAWHHLQPLSLGEVKDYVEHRLTTADWTGTPSLEEGIFPLLHEWSQGVPRKVNILMDRLLLFGYLEERAQLGRVELQAVIDELGQEFGRRAPTVPEPPAGAAEAGKANTEDAEEIGRRFAALERNVAELLGPAQVQELLEQEGEPGNAGTLLTRIDRMEKLLGQLRQKGRRPRRQGR